MITVNTNLGILNNFFLSAINLDKNNSLNILVFLNII